MYCNSSLWEYLYNIQYFVDSKMKLTSNALTSLFPSHQRQIVNLNEEADNPAFTENWKKVWEKSLEDKLPWKSFCFYLTPHTEMEEEASNSIIRAWISTETNTCSVVAQHEKRFVFTARYWVCLFFDGRQSAPSANNPKSPDWRILQFKHLFYCVENCVVVLSHVTICFSCFNLTHSCFTACTNCVTGNHS